MFCLIAGNIFAVVIILLVIFGFDLVQDHADYMGIGLGQLLFGLLGVVDAGSAAVYHQQDPVHLCGQYGGISYQQYRRGIYKDVIISCF